MRHGMMAAVLVAVAGAAFAQAPVPTETARLGKAQVTLHVQPFLTAQELATLRLVMTNESALEVFVPSKGGFAAMAVSPDEGFIREGVPVPSASALAGFADPAAAVAAALQACDGARKGKAPCVLVLEVGPAGK
ncbi:hypothetical protein [Pseudogemmobacter blasticus]|uniref:Uncharacterized protein n=1 Tax=Fuscovulum blasticum DSM 2131 TaxID=1188250 RepID=A0A2T4J7G0_FUSBL|nr:hypothetical protein [Fuscovulum blasticum]PTE13788.1 hypothetical protein C5F44_12100 [Fuscovulum blasticum DSM 2131]